MACPSATNCFAVGNYNTSGSGETLIEQWDGVSWSIAASPNTSATQSNSLRAIARTSVTSCFAVGYYFNGNFYRTLIEQWNGSSWSIVASPNTSDTQDNSLSGVTCSSATSCFAVGSDDDQTLIEQWDGVSWSIVASPNTSATQSNSLSSVTCASATNCFAVGSYNAGSNSQTLIEQWDGTFWSIVASPNATATQNDSLASVACTSATNCFAVGNYSSGITYRTLIEQWNGSSWSVGDSLDSALTQANLLYSVSCPSATECVAVGIYTNQTLTARWDGNVWSIVSSPNVAGQVNLLTGVDCPSASQCWAIGGNYANKQATQNLNEYYSPTIPALTSVKSRMTHGSVGTFDISLPLTGSFGIECRSSNALGAGNYSVVFSFVNGVTNCGTAATAGATVVPGPNANQCTQNLTGVSDAQYVNVELDNVVDSEDNTGSVSVPMGVLFGDVSGDGVVNVGDSVQVRSHSGETFGLSNFRFDLNADGAINVGDTAIVRSHSGDFLP